MSHTGRSASFPLLHMLDVVPGVFEDHLLPALQSQHKAALAGTCSRLRRTVQHSAQVLKLLTGNCCLVHCTAVATDLPRLQQLIIKPGNLHEAMFVVPLFLMKDAARLTGLTSLVLHDKLPDRPPDKVQCNNCLAWTSTYDLSAMLATAASCMPQLAALDFATHYISDAECAAIARMTGLTRLVLGSTHGFMLGGLSRMSGLRNLAHLRLMSNSLNCHAGDVVMLLNCSKLTHLTLGYYHTMTAPLLASLAELVQEATEGGGQQLIQASERGGRQQQQQQDADRQPHAFLSPRSAPQRPPQHTPPPLRELHLVLSTSMASSADCLRSTCCLTQLVQLSIGWQVGLGQAGVTLPLQTQAALSQLVHLTRLALGWPISYDSLGLLAPLTGLQSLQVGGLPCPWPPEPPPHTLRLPSISHLAVHVSVPFNLRATPDLQPPSAVTWVDCLPIFPGITCLELTGCILGYAIKRLVAAATTAAAAASAVRLSAGSSTAPPAPPLPTPPANAAVQIAASSTGCVLGRLRKLLLPQSLLRTSFADLAALRQLSSLTHLRLGWRATGHAGPPTYAAPPALPPSWLAGLVLEEMLPHPVQVAMAQPAAELDVWHQQQEHYGIAVSAGDDGRGGGRPPAPEQHPGLWLMWEDGQGDTEFARLEPAGPRWPPSLAALTPTTINHHPSRDGVTAGSCRAMRDEAGDAGAGSASTIASRRLSCSACGARPSVGCLCQLQSLEVVGPLCGVEVQQLGRLTALTALTLRDNLAWSSGLPLDDLAQAIARLSKLKHVDIIDCPGIHAPELERCIAKQFQKQSQQLQQCHQPDALDDVGGGGGASGGWRRSWPAVKVVNERSSPAELGQGYQWFGCSIDQAQLLGMVEGGQDADQDADWQMMHPQLPPPEHMWHWQ